MKSTILSATHLRKTAGFTLLELLVVTGIMLVVTGGSIASFISFNDRQQVQGAVKDVQTLLRSAQIKARSGEGAQLCQTQNRQLRGYEVIYSLSQEVDGQQIVTLNRVCYSGSTAFKTAYATKALTEGVTITPFQVEFLALKGQVLIGGNPAAPLSSATIGITGVAGSSVFAFTVSKSGEVTQGSFVTGIEGSDGGQDQGGRIPTPTPTPTPTPIPSGKDGGPIDSPIKE